MRIFLVLLCAVLAFMVAVWAGNLMVTRPSGRPAGRRLLIWMAVGLVPAMALLLARRWLFGSPTVVSSSDPLLHALPIWESGAADWLAPAYLLGYLLGSVPTREQIRAWRARRSASGDVGGAPRQAADGPPERVESAPEPAAAAQNDRTAGEPAPAELASGPPA